MEFVIEQRHLDAASEAGACEEIEYLVVGMPVCEVSQSDLIWFESRCPDLAAEASASLGVPLWAASDSGYGYGYGGGYGDGYDGDGGYGDGEGGYGGYGDGYGGGYGDGYGDGYGGGYGDVSDPRKGE